jgi:hypothetical protein
MFCGALSLFFRFQKRTVFTCEYAAATSAAGGYLASCCYSAIAKCRAVIVRHRACKTCLSYYFEYNLKYWRSEVAARKQSDRMKRAFGETQPSLCCEDAELNTNSLFHRQAGILNCVHVTLDWYQAMLNRGWGALDTCSIQRSVSVGDIRSSYLETCFIG